MKEYIAYKGSEFTIEWYFDVNGKSLALEYFNKQPKAKQRKLLNLYSGPQSLDNFYVNRS
jgi:hypothetical protein